MIKSSVILRLAQSILGFASFFFVCFATANAQPSAFDLSKISEVSKVKLSPSGQFLAFVEAKTSRVCVKYSGEIKTRNKDKCDDDDKEYRASYRLAIFDLEAGRYSKVIPLPDDLFPQWLYWANEDRLLTGVKKRSTIDERGYLSVVGGSRILSIPRGEGESFSFFQGDRVLDSKYSNFSRSRITNLLRRDPDHVVVPARKNSQLDLWKVNVNTGDFERVGNGTNATTGWFTDEDGNPVLRFDWVDATRSTKIYARTHGSENWELIRTVRWRKRADRDSADFSAITPAEERDQIYVYTDRDEGERRAIKIYDIKQNKYLDTIFEHERYDVAAAIIDNATGEYAGAKYYDDRVKYDFIDDSLDKHFDALNAVFDHKENVNLVGFNRDKTEAVIYVKGVSTPGDFYKYSLTEKTLNYLMSREPSLSNFALGTGEVLNIPTRDGTTITAYLTHPPGNSRGAAPTIIMPHGGPESRDYFDFRSRVQFYATRGYRVLQINFRGSSGYGHQFAKAGYGQWGRLMQDDVTDAVKHIYNMGLATSQNTCIVGYSYGGYVALYGAVATPELYKCVVSGGGVSDLVASVNESRKESGRNSSTYDYWIESIGDPSTDRERLEETSPVNFADQVQAPVLLLHGELDGIVYVNQSKKMRNALKKAGKDVTYIEFEHEGHNDWTLEHDIEYLTEIEKFLATHLTGGAKPAAQ